MSTENCRAFDNALFEIGIGIGRLPEDRTGPARFIVRSLLADLAELEQSVLLLADPGCHARERRARDRPRVFMRSYMNRVGTFRTVLSLAEGGADDFLVDPRRQRDDNRPVDEVFRCLMADGLFKGGSSYGGLVPELVRLILAAHRKAYGIVGQRLDMVVLEEPAGLAQPDGGQVLCIAAAGTLEASANAA